MRKEIRESIARVLRAIADEMDGAPIGLAQGIADVQLGRVVDVPDVPHREPDTHVRPPWPGYPNPYFGDPLPFDSSSTTWRWQPEVLPMTLGSGSIFAGKVVA